MKLLCFWGSLSLLVNLAFAKEVARPLYGLHEQVRLVEFEQTLEAKLDTGAKTASLHALDIERFRRAGKPWVRFYLDEARTRLIERPLLRVSRIKRRADDYDDEEDARSSSRRPVIALSLCLGSSLQQIEVNLTDRSAFRYPLLIGADALKQFSALIDPSLEHVAGTPSCRALTE